MEERPLTLLWPPKGTSPLKEEERVDLLAFLCSKPSVDVNPLHGIEVTEERIYFASHRYPDFSDYVQKRLFYDFWCIHIEQGYVIKVHQWLDLERPIPRVRIKCRQKGCPVSFQLNADIHRVQWYMNRHFFGTFHHIHDAAIKVGPDAIPPEFPYASLLQADAVSLRSTMSGLSSAPSETSGLNSMPSAMSGMSSTPSGRSGMGSMRSVLNSEPSAELNPTTIPSERSGLSMSSVMSGLSSILNSSRSGLSSTPSAMSGLDSAPSGRSGMISMPSTGSGLNSKPSTRSDPTAILSMRSGLSSVAGDASLVQEPRCNQTLQSTNVLDAWLLEVQSEWETCKEQPTVDDDTGELDSEDGNTDSSVANSIEVRTWFSLQEEHGVLNKSLFNLSLDERLRQPPAEVSAWLQQVQAAWDRYQWNGTTSSSVSINDQSSSARTNVSKGRATEVRMWYSIQNELRTLDQELFVMPVNERLQQLPEEVTAWLKQVEASWEQYQKRNSGKTSKSPLINGGAAASLTTRRQVPHPNLNFTASATADSSDRRDSLKRSLGTFFKGLANHCPEPA